jgi:transcription termination factor Rho
MVIEKARRLVEYGHDVVILMDSITRLGRAYNAEVPHSGKILSGGVDSNALQKPKRFFGSARNVEEGGSLTILGTCLIDTGSRMDEVIFQEFNGTGTMEMVLDRKCSEMRIWPAININSSGTRKEELLLDAKRLEGIHFFRRALVPLKIEEAAETMLGRLSKTKTNDEFLKLIAR